MLHVSTRRVARGPFSRLSPRTTPLLHLTPTRLYSVVADTADVPKKSKVWDSIDEAVKVVKPGDTILSGGECLTSDAKQCEAEYTISYQGFGLCGTPGVFIGT